MEIDMNHTFNISRRNVLALAASSLGLADAALAGDCDRKDKDGKDDRKSTRSLANELLGIKALELPPLAFEVDALAPSISSTTLQLHHGKHHKAYVDFLLRAEVATPGQISSFKTLDELVISAHRQGPSAAALFNNAAQHYNHSLQWLSLHPNGGGTPPKAVLEALERSFGGIDVFQQQWLDKAVAHFGSGWVWLVHERNSDKLQILSTSNAETPITTPGLTVLGTLDVWEHAYYVDYPAARKAYVQAAMAKLFNWRFVETQLARANDRRSRSAPNS
jgi:Fe-Mn family superoxide dismutase